MFKIIPNDPKDQKEADTLTALLNAIYNRAFVAAQAQIVEGYYPPKYNPWEEPIKFARHIQWQKFFRSKRKYAST